MANVLVVEDDRRVAAEIGSALAEYGFQVDEAPSGSIGLRKALGGNFDVIVLDRMLPEIDGLSLLTELRAAKVSTPVLRQEKHSPLLLSPQRLSFGTAPQACLNSTTLQPVLVQSPTLS